MATTELQPLGVTQGFSLLVQIENAGKPRKYEDTRRYSSDTFFFSQNRGKLFCNSLLPNQSTSCI